MLVLREDVGQMFKQGRQISFSISGEVGSVIRKQLILESSKTLQWLCVEVGKPAITNGNIFLSYMFI